MHPLNLPTYKFKIKSNENKYFIFDIVRKKYVSLTPEEWVRQHIVRYLVEEKKYPISLITIEKKLTINKLTKRTDIVVFNTDGLPHIIVECKAASVNINQDAFDQIARYNLKLKANYLFVSNGLNHYYCKMDIENETYIFLETIPKYNS
ncbi:MAG: restriction endonuclease subunit R [Lutibacter sp.]|uniref:type I restriction enzyme HsdR N-terminal domain-containing protein n=1 Tax=Lutibacter sp. TaxID=1925666 RepID=UPI0019D8073D|nr:type I restriction enzyme HsdR N-terminal domain-containing protein [Lutibacter sp.]NOR27372.1 restriction endonuclease subunit R [Lutibacter sp.]